MRSYYSYRTSNLAVHHREFYSDHKPVATVDREANRLVRFKMSKSRSGRAGENTLATLRATAGAPYLYNRNIGVVAEKDSTYAPIESVFQPIYRRE